MKAEQRGMRKVSGHAVMVPLNRANGIIYHTATRGLLLVRSDLWEILRTFSLGESASTCKVDSLSATKAELELLRKNRIIVSADEDERFFARYILNTMKFDTSQMGAFISFTSRCNFACGYCYQDFRKGSAPSDLTQRRWHQLFAFITKRVEELGVRNLSIALFGGEPLLDLEMVLRACHDLKSLEKNGCRSRITLITNGSLLSPSVWKELEPYVEFVQVTVDGNREIHDRCRPYFDGTGSYEVILENVSALLRQSPGRLGLRVNIQPETLPGVRDLLKDLSHLGMQQTLAAIGFHGVEPTQQQICAGVSNTRDVIRIASEVSELFVTAASMGFPVAKAFEVGPCMFTAANSVVVDEQLRLYKCPALLYWRSTGRLNAQGRAELSEEWYEAVGYEPRCAVTCKYGPICYGGCRAMMPGGEGRCPKPFFDVALESLIKAYVIAQHRIGLES